MPLKVLLQAAADKDYQHTVRVIQCSIRPPANGVQKEEVQAHQDHIAGLLQGIHLLQGLQALQVTQGAQGVRTHPDHPDHHPIHQDHLPDLLLMVHPVHPVRQAEDRSTTNNCTSGIPF